MCFTEDLVFAYVFLRGGGCLEVFGSVYSTDFSGLQINIKLNNYGL